jgi:hypothetical protein
MQQSHDGLIAYTNIFLMNQAYQESRKSNTAKGKEAAEKVIFACQDKIRELHVKFYLAPIGKWVLDNETRRCKLSHYDEMC